MLAALAGITLPILAHLISRRRFDVVEWGAMQFLELGNRTRRRIRLEEFLLLLLRIAMIAVIAFVFARPWASGGLFANFGSGNYRDVVLVLDASYSMGWEGRSETPRAASIQLAHQILDELRPGDQVALIDARDEPALLIDSPTHDRGRIREVLDNLPPPTGSTNLPAAIAEAVQILSSTTNLSREVIVISDGQSHGWKLENQLEWDRVDELRQQPSVQPNIWNLRVGEDDGDKTNFTVEQIELSRETTVPGFPVRFSTNIRYSGGDAPITRKVYFEVDGQRLSDKTTQVQLQPDGEATVEFEHRFRNTGSNIVSIVVDADNLPGDNRADAAIVVKAGIPVLLVNGDPNVDPVRNETFFAKAALSASLNDSPWVDASVRDWDALNAEDFDRYSVIILANVPRLDDATQLRLRDFVLAGGGLIFAPGDRVDAIAYESWEQQDSFSLLPARMTQMETVDANDPAQMTVRPAGDTFDAPWMQRFKSENCVDFDSIRLSNWWKLSLFDRPAPKANADGEDDETQQAQPQPIILGRLNTRDPFVVSQTFGQGQVLQLSSPIDADWSTLPAKNDFVPFLHEMVFALTTWKSGRNVWPGSTLSLPIAVDDDIKTYFFVDPDDKNYQAELGGNELRPRAVFSQTSRAGIYRANRTKQNAQEAIKNTEYFVVNFDRSESDLKPLDPLQQESLQAEDRMAFVSGFEELQSLLSGKDQGTELWRWLLFGFLGFMILELWMTRRLVQGGHEFTDGPETAEDEQDELGGNSAPVPAT